jgi:ATP-dependent Clp protease protease subunit
MKQQLRFVNEAPPKIANGVIRGVAAVFNQLSNDLGGFREIIRPGAFDRSLKEIAAGQRHVDARIQHQGGLHVCGTTANGTLRLWCDNVGLNYEITPPDTTDGKDLVVMVRDGYLRHSSFAFECSDDSIAWNWSEKPPVVEVHDLDLIDVAPCSRPAYDETTVAVRSMMNRAPGLPKFAKAGTRIEAKAEGTGTVVEFHLYDAVKPSWMAKYIDGLVTASSITNQLKEYPDAERIDVFINSPGGDVFEGLSIFNTLKDHAAPVHVTVRGVAGSIAGVIAMAGDHIKMGEGTFLMVHGAVTGVMGNAQDMREMARLLDKVDASIAGILSRRSGADMKIVEKWMKDETWFTAEEAIDRRLADRVAGEKYEPRPELDGERCRELNLRNIPECLGGSDVRTLRRESATLDDVRQNNRKEILRALDKKKRIV